MSLAAGANAASTVTGSATNLTKTPEAIGASVVVGAETFKIDVLDDLDLNGRSLQIDFSAAPVPALIPATLVVDTCAAEVMADVVYAGVTNGGKTVNYTISGNNATPASCDIMGAGFHFAPADVTTSGITAASSFTIVGSGVGQSTATKILAKGAPQYSITVATPANEKIDVNDDRESFAGGDNDTIIFSIGDTGTAGTINGVAFGAHEIEITGDFSWADDPKTVAFDPTTANNGITPVQLTNATLDAVKSTSTKLVFDAAANNSPYTLTLTPLTDANLTDALTTNDRNAVEIPVQSFTVGTVLTFTDKKEIANGTVSGTVGATATVAAKAAGAHSLNGASVKIFSVPFGPEVESHNIFVSNSGKATGAITGSMAWNGNPAVAFSLGNVEAGANKYLNIMGALEALGEKPPFGRADITLTVNAPENQITFTAGYTTAAGRANLFMQEQANMAIVSSAANTNAAAGTVKATAAATDAACVKAALAAGNEAQFVTAAAASAATTVA